LRSLGLSHIVLDSAFSGDVENTLFIYHTGAVLPSGPHIRILSADPIPLHKTYGTFYDQFNSFAAAYTDNDDSSHSYLRLSHPEQMEIIVPVPSKLYYSLLDPRVYPLAGLRFAIKDIVEVDGIVMAGRSREYARLYDEPRNSTAPAIRKLLDLGVVSVENTKAATFAGGAWPDQNVDLSYP
jgi:hypothetical protein